MHIIKRTHETDGNTLGLKNLKKLITYNNRGYYGLT